MKRLLPVVLLIPVIGCASAQAKTPPNMPALEVPPPPPRVIDASPPAEPPPPEPVITLPSVPVNPRPRQTPPSREPAKPEPKTEPPPVVEPPAPIQPPVPPLRTPGTPDAEASRQVREVIDRAKKTLGSIDYRALTPQQRAQYDSAKMLITQSEDALKSTNFEFARNLADKAERIARELQGR
jgi:outer membrane biosynthesis protein TonB